MDTVFKERKKLILRYSSLESVSPFKLLNCEAKLRKLFYLLLQRSRKSTTREAKTLSLSLP